MKQTAVVTGASRGIGAAVACALADQGYRVAGIYHQHAAEMDRLAQHHGILPIAADLADPVAVANLAPQILAQLGQVDVLVHCAGVACHGLFQCLTPDQVTRLYRINLAAPIQLTRALLPHMLARHQGNILCVSSMWGEVGASCEVDYSVTKGALLTFVRALAKEVGPSGIRVNAVSPGTILTDMTVPLGPQVLEDLAEETALCRLGTPQDVAQAVCFLISDQAGYITGQNLSVNGGI